jgi:hypothetical protein
MTRERRNPAIRESESCFLTGDREARRQSISGGWKQFPKRSKDIGNILNVANVAGSRSGREDRDRLRCALEVDGERLAQEMLCLANVVDKVADHPSCFDEG